MSEEYCGVKFKTIFRSKQIPNNPKVLELINWCKEFHKMGFVSGYTGNLSFRTDKGFIISCSRADFLRATLQEFVEVIGIDITKKEVYAIGIKEPSAESFMHNEIYKKRKDVNAVFHGHNEDFLRHGEKLNLPITEKEQLGGTIELMKEVAKILGNNNFLLIRNHGFLSLGDSIGSAGNLAVKRYNQLQRVK